MNIIFDYYLTIFDPETGELYPKTYGILEKLSKEHKLFLFTYNEYDRAEFMKSSQIEKFFTKICLVDKKDKDNMLKVIDEANSADTTLVVGDRVQSEIRIGNELGYETIWLKQGKFGKQLPSDPLEKPKYIIHSLGEIFNILEKYKNNIGL